MHFSEEQNFLKAYDEHADQLYRYIFFRVFSESRAEELVQETFMKTWEFLQKGKTVDNLKAFLYRVAGNLIIDQSRKHTEASLEVVLENSPTLEPSIDGEKVIQKTIIKEEVHALLNKLPPDERELLILRYINELEPREIAKILNITVNNVSVKIHRALILVRQYIKV